MKLNLSLTLFLVVLVSMYHFYIHNRLEKMFSRTHFEYDSIKRPNLGCIIESDNQGVRCIGMPSGHAETSAVFAFLLFFHKIIPLWVCLLFIVSISIQRITSHMHTINQVIIGSMLGYFYAYIYHNYYCGFGIILTIGIILYILSMYQMNNQLNNISV